MLKSIIYKTEYDLLGRVSKETYPSGYAITNSYDSYGYLTDVTDANNQSIWKVLESNAKGQLKKTQFGSRTKTYEFDSRGFPTAIVSSGIMNMTYVFDSKGNLGNRKDLLTNQEEKLRYDSQDRLKESEVWKNSVVMSLDYNTYNETTGNTTSKMGFASDMKYGENSKPPHALTSSAYSSYYNANIANPQVITYTDFKKVKSISENGNALTITYGVDEQRIKSVQTKANISSSRYYLGNYEEETVSNNTNIRKIHYISGGNGLAAIFVDNSAKSDTLYYAHTDYQGSLIALSLENGTVKEKYAYDPWGKRRNPNSWYLDDARTSFAIHRGYTMHEHLDPFNLINMNGRVYDPLAGVFLSPDPYIQAPGNWLNYNRYAYCLNNPMRYTDPSGEWVHLAIGAFIGGVTNWAMNGFKFNAKGLGYFGVGALAGALGAGIGSGISSALPIAGQASGGFAAGFLGTSAATTATSSFVSGALIGGGAGLSSGFVSGFGNGLSGGQSFGQALGQGGIYGLIGGGFGGLTGGLAGGINAYRDGRDFWDGFDYQKTLDKTIVNEKINNPNSKWLVANKKNAQLVNNTYNTNIKVSGNKIYVSSDEYTEYGLNIGARGKGNTALISKQAIRNKTNFSLTDIIRHENTHQLQILSGQTMNVSQMEYGAYMTNIINPATRTTIQNVFNILVNDWSINPSTLWETILNFYPYGPIP